MFREAGFEMACGWLLDVLGDEPDKLGGSDCTLLTGII
jgi:hypothetical protein